MTADEAREEARRRIRRGEAEIEIEPHDRVVELTDPDSPGWAVECWIYVMEGSN